MKPRVNCIFVAAFGLAMNVSSLAGSISGTVSAPDGATPLQGIEVTAATRMDTPGPQWYAWTDTNGHYIVEGLDADTYRVGFYDPTGMYYGEWYGDAKEFDYGSNIVLQTETTVTGIDVSMLRASQISGRVSGPDGTTPLANVLVELYYPWDQSRSQASTFTDTDGNYMIGGLAAGTYRLRFSDYGGDYLPEAYSNAADVGSATNIVVPTETNVSGIDASLSVASRISGIVTGTNGTPLEYIDAIAHRWNGSSWSQAGRNTTDASGRYTISGLSPDVYKVSFYVYAWRLPDYAPAVYSNQLDLSGGTSIAVPPGTTVSNIDASLVAASRISGTVTGPDGTTPVEHVEAVAYMWNGSAWDRTVSRYTDATGKYVIGALAAGTYRVRFELDYWNYDYAPEVYSNAIDVGSGNDIVVSAGSTVTNINASLEATARISGQVTGPDGVTPLQGITARAYRWNGSTWESMFYQYGDTGPDGAYTVSRLASGNYRVLFYESDGKENYLSEVYEGGTDLETGTNISVASGTTVPGINASLALVPLPPPPAFVGLRSANANDIHLMFTGTVSRCYVLQESPALSNAWCDVATPALCAPGTNTFSRLTPWPTRVWRLRMLR